MLNETDINTDAEVVEPEKATRYELVITASGTVGRGTAEEEPA